MDNDQAVAEAPETSTESQGGGRARVYNRADAVVGGRSEIPRDLYRVRCIKSKLSQSTSGDDMITLTIEIIDPETITVPRPDGEIEVSIAGRQAMIWLIFNDEEQWGSARAYAFMDKLGLEVTDSFDPNDHKELFVGMAWDMILESEENIARKAPRMVDGRMQKEGDIIKDGEGNPIKLGYRVRAQVDDVPDHCRPEMTELPQANS